MTQIEELRKSFIQEILDKVRNIPKNGDFYLHTFYVIACHGLQMKAKKEGLFRLGDWSDPKQREFLIGKVEKFLTKYTK